MFAAHFRKSILPLIRRYSSRIGTTQYGGPVGYPSHRVYFERNGSPISPWHDIPLVANKTTNEYNMVCEVPRWTNAKLEINTTAAFNPIRQDSKRGRLRYVADVFPYKGYIWNYGMLPQTFEDPTHVDADTGCAGDSDPVDVVEIGQGICAEGSVHRVKALGVVALIDDGETDWKILAIRADDPLAEKVNSIECLDRYMPGLVNATVDWFTKYKVPDGKPANKWAFDGVAKNADYAHKVIADTHEAWRELIHAKNSEFALTNTTMETSPHYLPPDDASVAFRALTDTSPGQMLNETAMHAMQKAEQQSSSPAGHGGGIQPASSKWFYVQDSKVANS